MLICHCRKVNDGVARAAIEAGATDLQGLAEICRAGSGCGGCHPMLEELLRGAGSKVSGSKWASAALGGLTLDEHFPRPSQRVLSPA